MRLPRALPAGAVAGSISAPALFLLSLAPDPAPARGRPPARFYGCPYLCLPRQARGSGCAPAHQEPAPELARRFLLQFSAPARSPRAALCGGHDLALASYQGQLSARTASFVVVSILGPRHAPRRQEIYLVRGRAAHHFLHIAEIVKLVE